MKSGFKRICVKLVLLSLTLALLCSLTSCGSDMPFNGDILFNEISLTIPADFVRDSTQSNDDLWIFEKDQYTKYIIIARNDIKGDVSASIDSYVEYMMEQGADSARTTFLQMDAVLSVYTLDDELCQEMLFAYNGSFYAIALRGGTEADFDALLDTVEINE